MVHYFGSRNFVCETISSKDDGGGANPGDEFGKYTGLALVHTVHKTTYLSGRSMFRLDYLNGVQGSGRGVDPDEEWEEY